MCYDLIKCSISVFYLKQYYYYRYHKMPRIKSIAVGGARKKGFFVMIYVESLPKEIQVIL